MVDRGGHQRKSVPIWSGSRPRFVIGDSPDALTGLDKTIDFAVAQSIFSHSGPDLVKGWLTGLAPLLSSSGALVATFVVGEKNCNQNGWTYPDCVEYRSNDDGGR